MAKAKAGKVSGANGTGRPSLYDEKFNEQVYNLCRIGAIDKDIADFFGVTETTINNWKIEHPCFFESIKKGKSDADQEVACSLFKRAKGATRIIQKEVKLKSSEYENGKKVSEEERVEVVDLKVEEPPDTTAIIFFLKNRRPDLWRDKTETQLTGNPDEPVVVEFDVGNG